MMIDRHVEDLRPLCEAVRLWVPPNPRTGRPPSAHTAWRWSRRGLRVGDRTIRLEVLQIGGSAHTSREALDRFFSALTEAHEALIAEPADAARSPETAERLARLGLLETAGA